MNKTNALDQVHYFFKNFSKKQKPKSANHRYKNSYEITIQTLMFCVRIAFEETCEAIWENPTHGENLPF